MVTSPYNIGEGKHKEIFYGELSEFTDKVLKKAHSDLSELVQEYTEYLKENNIRTYTYSEHLTEVLMTGVYWSNYSEFLSADSVFYAPLFNFLYKGRKRYKFLKKRLDSLRGKLSTSILMKEHNMNIPLYRRFDYLNSWLGCTKEFNQELERLQHWQNFTERMSVSEQQVFWNKTEAFAKWFIYEADEKLGTYTAGWENFIIDTADVYKNREDYIFCTRKPSEYHLNMVAAEVMNRALANGFDEAEKKIVLLPTCMSKSDKCNAKVVDGSLKCQMCNRDCNVAKLTLEHDAKGVETVLIPHSSGFSKYLEPWKNQDDTALVGVACVLNLLTGGYEMQKLNIPSQCVFLDSCSCKKHWLSGNPTEINNVQLNKVMYAPGKESVPASVKFDKQFV